MSDLSAIRAKVYAATTEQHAPLLTRYEARYLLGRIEALERISLSIIRKTADEALEVPDELR